MEKRDWKRNPVIKGWLLSCFVLLTIATAVVTGVVVNLIKNRVYEDYPQDYLVVKAQERVLEEDADVINEILLDYINMHDMDITTEDIDQYKDDMIRYIEDKFANNIGDDFYRFEILFFPDTDLEIEVYGDEYNPYMELDDTVVATTFHYYPYAWTEVCKEKYTFDTYDDLLDFESAFEEETLRNESIGDVFSTEILPESELYFDGFYPTIPDGYQFKVEYEKTYSTKFCIIGELTNGYESGPYLGKGHDLKREIERINWMYEVKTNLLVLMVVLCLALLVCSIFIMISAGHVPDSEELQEKWSEKVPLEVILAIIGLIIWGVSSIYRDVHDVIYRDITGVDFQLFNIFFIGYVICLLILGLFCCRTLAIRTKANRIFTSSLICRFLKKYLGIESTFMKMQREVGSKIPFMWKAILIFIFIELIEFISLLMTNATGYTIIYYLTKLCIIVFVIVVISWLQELKKGGEELVAGNTKHKVNTRFMKWAFKEHGENLNNLNEGLQLAVEERMKSERMKTELITNVSHDIKTPLTSIINYVDLLQKQNITSEPEASYIDVLARQSARLKKLIDDLVEASKASSGSVPVEMKVMDANLVLAQATAEYIDKLAEKELRLVVSEASEPALVRADGRHLWRVIDNLLNNAYKYAMPGTRVYTNVETVEDKVQITFKNISKDELNVSSDELMERFVRGDSSRNTEGSGLGLSIAKSLCQLMEADFDIEIDGDMYKAIITFDLLTEEDREIEDILSETDNK